MSNSAQTASHRQAANRENWTGTQAYVLAVSCLVLGVALGYLFRGSASPVSGDSSVCCLPTAAWLRLSRPQRR